MKSIFLRSTPVTGISTCCCVTKGETTGEGEGEEGMTGEADPAGGTEEDELDEEVGGEYCAMSGVTDARITETGAAPVVTRYGGPGTRLTTVALALAVVVRVCVLATMRVSPSHV